MAAPGFLGWMLDVARDQSPSEEWLSGLLRDSKAAGYNALGLYLEHRFAYPSAPWAAGPGCLTPEAVRRLARKAREHGIRLIPFLNTLGHMEGFIRTEGGQWLAEGQNEYSLSLCPSRPECVAFARGLVEDAMAAFDDEWVHLGGDEAFQLGQCPLCAARAKVGGVASIYAEHYAALCEFVLKRGRRPCLWADMLLKHPETLDLLPKRTLLFDWQYFDRPAGTSARLRERGFDVVCCPSIQTYNSGWCFLDETQKNIDQHAEDAAAIGALGVCVTTWEFTYFSQVASIIPLVLAAGLRLSGGVEWSRAIRRTGGLEYAVAAKILGRRIPAAAEFLRPGTWRALRDRLVIRQNPFLLWRDWRFEACGEGGDQVLRLSEMLLPYVSAESPMLPALLLHRAAVLWVRRIEQAASSYAQRHFALCAERIRDGMSVLAELRPGLIRAAERGGSSADPQRLDRLLTKAHNVMDRVTRLAGMNPTILPSFETVTHDRYIPGDQAAWLTGDLRSRQTED